MMKARTTPHRSHHPVARQAIWLPLLLACLAAPASGADAQDQSQLTVGRIFGQEQEFKTEDWGPAYWLKDSSGYTTLEVAERFKDSGTAKALTTIKDIVRYAPESGQRDILVAAESLIPPGQPRPLPIEDYAWSDDANKVQERYMGLPADNEAGCKNGSPITFAHQLKGNLLLVYGTGDDNCHYQNCEVLVNELIRQNKPFAQMPYPNRTHAIKEGDNTKRHLFETLTRYLAANLPVTP